MGGPGLWFKFGAAEFAPEYDTSDPERGPPGPPGPQEKESEKNKEEYAVSRVNVLWWRKKKRKIRSGPPALVETIFPLPVEDDCHFCRHGDLLASYQTIPPPELLKRR